jgi:hypothetical protein
MFVVNRLQVQYALNDPRLGGSCAWKDDEGNCTMKQTGEPEAPLRPASISNLTMRPDVRGSFGAPLYLDWSMLQKVGELEYGTGYG